MPFVEAQRTFGRCDARGCIGTFGDQNASTHDCLLNVKLEHGGFTCFVRLRAADVDTRLELCGAFFLQE